MVSLHKALSMSPNTEAPSEFQKKRKFEEIPLTTDFFKKDHTNHHLEKTKSFFDFELHLKTPLPSDKFQPYLTFQSRMNMKAQDSKKGTEPEQISLDLELNLTCESVRKKEETSYEKKEKKKNLNELDLLNIESKKLEYKNDISSSCSPSWLTSSISSSSSSSDGDYKEMIATVCMRCHMLVMLCKSSPSCPNCKFMHPPPDQNPSKFLKRRRFSLLC